MAGIMATKSPPKPFRQQAVICEPRVDGGDERPQQCFNTSETNPERC